MHGDAKDYYYYDRWTYLIPITLLGTVVGLGLFTPLVAWLIKLCVKRCCDPKLEDHIAVRYLSNALRDIVIRANKFFLYEFDYTETDMGQFKRNVFAYTMYGATVKLYVLQYFFIVFICLVLVSIILFWNTFTSDVFIGCDPYYDCFPLHAANETPIQLHPIKDCSEFADNSNITILCFQLVYRYSEGIGEAGGFLFIMQVLVNLLIYITVRVRTSFTDIYLEIRSRSSEPHCVNARCIKISTLIVTTVVIPLCHVLVTIGVPLGFYQIRPEFYESLQTPQRFLQFMIYLFINFVLVLIPMFVGKGTKDNLPKENRNKIDGILDSESIDTTMECENTGREDDDGGKKALVDNVTNDS